MARKKMDITVVATHDPQAPDGVHFELKNKNVKLPKVVFNKDTEKMYKPDEHDVHFHLQQGSGMTLQFAQHPDDAFWIHWGDETDYPSCPQTKPSTCPDPVFHAYQSTPNLLKALNKNPEKRLFRFALSFVDPNSPTPNKLITFDPDGGNEDGGSDPRFEIGGISTSTIVVGVTVALIVGFFLLS